MKGFIYKMFKGADPSVGWEMTDPIFGKVPTMGACRPDIRRQVEEGDYIFPISGLVGKIKPHVVGAFAVDEKIDALIANSLFPENIMKVDAEGKLTGNIIVDKDGNHFPFDYHTNFENRIDNYIIGKDPIYFENPEEIQLAKDETLNVVNSIFGTNEDSIYKIVGRFGKKIDAKQVEQLLNWMQRIKHTP